MEVSYILQIFLTSGYGGIIYQELCYNNLAFCRKTQVITIYFDPRTTKGINDNENNI